MSVTSFLLCFLWWDKPESAVLPCFCLMVALTGQDWLRHPKILLFPLLTNFSERDSITERYWTSQFSENVVSVLSLSCFGVFHFGYFDFICVCLFWWDFFVCLFVGFFCVLFFIFKAACKYC